MNTKLILVASIVVALFGCQPQAPEQKTPAPVAAAPASAPVQQVAPAPVPVPAPVEKAVPAPARETPVTAEQEKTKPAIAAQKPEKAPRGAAIPPASAEPPASKVEKSEKKVSGGAVAAAIAGKNPQVEMKTSEGTLVIELFQDKAPISVGNFLQYAGDKFYNGTVFHRVIDGFMIQGGGYTPDMKLKETRPPIQNEAQNGLKNLAGTLAMARTSKPDSAAAQFFINLVDNTSLDYPKPDGAGYAVFGKVISGMDVVQKIRSAATGNVAGQQNVPRVAIVIESVALLSAKSSRPAPAAAPTSAAAPAPALTPAPETAKLDSAGSRATVATVADATFDATVLPASRPVLVFFWAEWCAPCRAAAPIVDGIAETYAGRLSVVKLSIVGSPLTPKKFDLTAVPTYMLFKNGKPAGSIKGKQTDAELKAFIDGNL